MPGGIFVIQADGKLVELEQQPYDSEDLLQRLLADYPDLLAGKQVDPEAPRRWLLVTREAPVPGEVGGAGRWSVDHLFLDQDGIPTLVEVKRSTDTRIRREVVGQILDYAANSVVYWPVEHIQAQLGAQCERTGRDPSAVVGEFLGPDQDPSAFWDRVKTNLQAGRIRLLLVADQIPAELRRIVEFLNGQMDPAEILAVEIQQFTGEGVRTLVPRVIGRTEQATAGRNPGARPSHQWDEASFFEELTARAGESAAGVARALLSWGEGAGLDVWWGRGQQDGSFLLWAKRGGAQHYLISCWTYGRVEILFQYMKSQGAFQSLELREELRRRFNEVPSVKIDADALDRRPRVVLADLAASPGAVGRFTEVLEWMRGKINDAPR